MIICSMCLQHVQGERTPMVRDGSQLEPDEVDRLDDKMSTRLPTSLYPFDTYSKNSCDSQLTRCSRGDREYGRQYYHSKAS